MPPSFDCSSKCFVEGGLKFDRSVTPIFTFYLHSRFACVNSILQHNIYHKSTQWLPRSSADPMAQWKRIFFKVSRDYLFSQHRFCLRTSSNTSARLIHSGFWVTMTSSASRKLPSPYGRVGQYNPPSKFPRSPISDKSIRCADVDGRRLRFE